MATIKIDNQTYDVDTLSKEAKVQVASLQFVDVEVARLQARLAAMKTARLAYANALKATLSASASGSKSKPS